MSVMAWGLGKSGQLGNGSTSNQLLPHQVPQSVGDKGAVCIAVGGLSTAFITAEGKLYTFGCGKHGRLGTAKEVDEKLPILVDALKDQFLLKVSCGSWHGAAIDSKGQLYIWGYGKTHGVLGQPLPDLTTFGSPQIVPSLTGNQIVGVTCGNNFTLAWDKDGQAYSWGYGKYGVLGHGDTQDKLTPTIIETLKNRPVEQISAGFSHCGAVCNGSLFMFGQGKYGALGLGPKKLADALVPVALDMEEEIAEVSCSVGEHHCHTLAVSKEGLVYAWGDGYKGKLGLGHQESKFTPTQIPVEHFSGEMIAHVSSGGIHSSAVSHNGHIFTWGCGSDGRLGFPEAQGHRYLFRSDKPRMMEGLATAKQVAASYYHTVALMSAK